MLFVGGILCITARGCLPSRRVVRTGAWVCFYGCHHALACASGPSSFVCGEIGSANTVTPPGLHTPNCRLRKSMLRCGQIPRPK